MRVALVLSAGGLRGAAHVGVLRRLVAHGVPIDAIVGVSAGAVVAAYYAAVGLDLDELAGDARSFRGRHLLAHSLRVKLNRRCEAWLQPWCGVIPERLRQLQAASFDRLHHGVRCLGIACHDLRTRRPRYFRTGLDHRAPLYDAVMASASIPFLFPAVRVHCGGEELRLTDGGISNPVPVAFARDAGVGATHVIVSDCRWLGNPAVTDSRTVWIRPRLGGTGTLWSPRQGLAAAVRGGEAAVTPEILSRLDAW
jgi:NTE family protein